MRTANEPSSGTVESLLAQIDALPEGQGQFELFVPRDLRMQDCPVAQDLAMAVVLDRLLGRGLFPDGFEQWPSGRLYRYASTA